MFDVRGGTADVQGAGFAAGFASRHDTTANVLAAAFAPAGGFSAVDMRGTHRAAAHVDPTTFAAQGGPRHFSPADPTTNPTEGWDLMDPDSAHDASFVNPLEAAHSAGYAEGLAAAAAAQADVAERDRALLTGLAAAIGSGDRIDREQVAQRLRQTVLFLVTKLVGEVGIAPDLMAARIAAASDLLAEAGEPALLRVNPDDVHLLDGHLPNSVFAAGDATIARGTFVMESASTIIEDGPELWLEQLARAIDRVPVPPLC
ncbi:flagellar biosynthesis protein FliH [Sphingomonas sp. Leaf17]|nr:flagellar biosynthesis protein FliH [Sphingomonas sp. Leaf17]